MSVRARPLADRIIVRRDTPEEMTEGGILLPQSAQKPMAQGEVLMVGPGAYNAKGTLIPMSLKPGDKVIFGTYAGVEIKVDGEDYQIMREGDVSCVIEGDAKVVTEDAFARRTEVNTQYE